MKNEIKTVVVISSLAIIATLLIYIGIDRSVVSTTKENTATSTIEQVSTTTPEYPDALMWDNTNAKG